MRLTADGHAVVCHDATAHGLKLLNPQPKSWRLPQLREVLARYQSTAFLDIELKVSGLEAIATDLLRKLTPARGFVVSSFLPEVLRTIHELDATIPLGLICETQAELSLWPSCRSSM